MIYFNRLKLDNSHVDESLYKTIELNFKSQKFLKGNVIYPESDVDLNVVKFIFFKKGRAKSIFLAEDGEFILYMLEDGNIDIIAGTCIIEFVDDSEVYIVKHESVLKLLKDTKFAQMLLTSIMQKSVLERRIIKNLAFGKCRKRVAYFLLDMVHHYKSEHIPLDFDMSVQSLANFIGSQRQTVSGIFNELLQKNIIAKTDRKHFVVLDLEKLKEYAKYDITI